MGLFSKRERAVIPPTVIGTLGAFGQASVAAALKVARLTILDLDGNT